ncbi:MAG: hypothetical protein CMD88_04500 [Gammaproteobacteria bacterium]|nr:hypothetical protein [Gammaproteobacteria bacterium]|tara:strand:- start:16 stop:240 length:225 start_codon:yes stop_codon:yes gene_type:complete
MIESKALIELIEKINKLMPKNGDTLRSDFKENIKILIEEYIKKMNLITKEEFDVQKEVLLKTRLKLEEIEKKIK